MPVAVTITDETAHGRALHTFALDFLTEHVTVREIIRSRVYQEVQEYNARSRATFSGLVQPAAIETALNGERVQQWRPIDWEQQVALALAGFEANKFFLLIDDRQVEDLDAVVELRPDTCVTFVKLVPLVGG